MPPFLTPGLSVACYCVASIVMTVVNKVCVSVFLDTAATAMTNAENDAVRCLWTQLFHELPVVVHTVPRMRRVRFGSEEVRSHLIPQFRYGRCQVVVSYQLLAGRRYLYWLEESGEPDQRTFVDLICIASIRLSQQFLTIPVYTIFKNLTIILIVRVVQLSRVVRCLSRERRLTAKFYGLAAVSLR
jgi:hypothetical protein